MDNISNNNNNLENLGDVNLSEIDKANEKIKKAYSVIGVKEGATRDEIEYRYFILAKKHLILKRESISSEVVGLNMEKINEAYYTLINECSETQTTDTEQNKNKPKEIIYYILKNYKKITAIAATIIIFAALLIVNLKNNKVNIVFFGEFNDSYDNESNYNYLQALKDSDINDNISVQHFFLLENLELPHKIQMMSAAYSYITGGDYHILIMDKKSFEEYGTVANIEKLDEIVEELNLENKGYSMLKKDSEDQKEHIYGIYLNSYPNECSLTDSDYEYIMSIRAGLKPAINKTVMQAIRLLTRP